MKTEHEEPPPPKVTEEEKKIIELVLALYGKGGTPPGCHWVNDPQTGSRYEIEMRVGKTDFVIGSKRCLPKIFGPS